ncbi:hypothetical protein [Streptomyces sp. NPDC004042]|uniref:hypothetical protein n=1 Tax=Streptomyces sp. NPDC004042 TaxID=3154451 RepID=UPI0033B3240B
MTNDERPAANELVGILGTGEGCAVCGTLSSFTTDSEAVEHLMSHDPRAVAWSLLREKAYVHRMMLAADEPGGITSEDEIEDVFREVDLVADESPARPTSL